MLFFLLLFAFLEQNNLLLCLQSVLQSSFLFPTNSPRAWTEADGTCFLCLHRCEIGRRKAGQYQFASLARISTNFGASCTDETGEGTIKSPPRLALVASETCGQRRGCAHNRYHSCVCVPVCVCVCVCVSVCVCVYVPCVCMCVWYTHMGGGGLIRCRPPRLQHPGASPAAHNEAGP
jgi:hypothetical protein